jgi:hypothetical protein
MKLRAPAIPLITIDPYFSIWSPADTINSTETVHWTGKSNAILGTVTVDGKKYLFLSDIHIINHSEPNELSFVFEFASADNPEWFENLSLEHGKFVFENNAVAKLSEF